MRQPGEVFELDVAALWTDDPFEPVTYVGERQLISSDGRHHGTEPIYERASPLPVRNAAERGHSSREGIRNSAADTVGAPDIPFAQRRQR